MLQKFLTVTQNCFLHQHINNPTHVRPNLIPTLTDLIFTSNDQANDNLSFLSLLGQTRHYISTPSRVKSIEVGYNYHKVNYSAIKRKLNDIDWKERFQGKNVNLSWKTFLKLLNDIILKYTPRFNFKNKHKKSIWLNSQAESLVEKQKMSFIFTH